MLVQVCGLFGRLILAELFNSKSSLATTFS